MSVSMREYVTRTRFERGREKRKEKEKKRVVKDAWEDDVWGE